MSNIVPRYRMEIKDGECHESALKQKKNLK